MCRPFCTVSLPQHCAVRGVRASFNAGALCPRNGFLREPLTHGGVRLLALTPLVGRPVAIAGRRAGVLCGPLPGARTITPFQGACCSRPLIPHTHTWYIFPSRPPRSPRVASRGSGMHTSSARATKISSGRGKTGYSSAHVSDVTIVHVPAFAGMTDVRHVLSVNFFTMKYLCRNPKHVLI